MVAYAVLCYYAMVARGAGFKLLSINILGLVDGN